MAYESLEQEFRGIKLGGIDQKTGKKNPTEIEGYYLGFEQRPNKFNPTKPQHFYKFQTSDGLVGVYGTSAGLVRAMRNAVEGRMTKLVDTGETLDTGKGNPMRVFKAWQDKNNTIDPASIALSDEVTAGNYEDPTDEDSEEESLDEVTPARATRPAIPVSTPSSSSQARVQALLGKSKR